MICSARAYSFFSGERRVYSTKQISSNLNRFVVCRQSAPMHRPASCCQHTVLIDHYAYNRSHGRQCVDCCVFFFCKPDQIQFVRGDQVTSHSPYSNLFAFRLLTLFICWSSKWRKPLHIHVRIFVRENRSSFPCAPWCYFWDSIWSLFRYWFDCFLKS